ncbi:MAG: ZIP family metal transporter [Proteobacteria bacterium]|nr:ZIP family metal transporter [Pseudomonadota bacterium]
MTVLLWIVASSLLGGTLSVFCAALFALNARAHWVNALVSYAIGALLGAVFLDILPEAIKLTTSGAALSGTILAGILLFFTLEKLLLWRHCHHDHCEVHEPHDVPQVHRRTGLMLVVGGGFHNFVDGVIIAAAFLTDVHLGVVTALAITAHEIPQEVGDFMILLHTGYSRAQALMLNMLASLATLAGGVLAYFALQSMQGVVPTLLGLAAASMIYIAVADLIPGLHQRTRLRDTLEQVLLIVAGVSSIFLVNLAVGA